MIERNDILGLWQSLGRLEGLLHKSAMENIKCGTCKHWQESVEVFTCRGVFSFNFCKIDNN